MKTSWVKSFLVGWFKLSLIALPVMTAVRACTEPCGKTERLLAANTWCASAPKFDSTPLPGADKPLSCVDVYLASNPNQNKGLCMKESTNIVKQLFADPPDSE
jgi:hypothetical protein